VSIAEVVRNAGFETEIEANYIKINPCPVQAWTVLK
jgi:hypothetical protein